MQISGCSAVVTGGTGGMGEATVRRLHAGDLDGPEGLRLARAR
jgi:NAD(P)-dependent dehydrogenase (short-subunit alcohol dehydrogenase family)